MRLHLYEQLTFCTLVTIVNEIWLTAFSSQSLQFQAQSLSNLQYDARQELMCPQYIVILAKTPTTCMRILATQYQQQQDSHVLTNEQQLSTAVDILAFPAFRQRLLPAEPVQKSL